MYWNTLQKQPHAVVTASLKPIEGGNRTLVDFLFRELLFFITLAFLAYSVCLFIVVSHKDFWHLVWNSGDNLRYIHIAEALREWNPQIIGKVKHFWGTGYGILAVHILSLADYGTCLLLLSIFCGVLGVAFAYRLYGRAVAAWFIFISAALMQRILVGGSEPLFVALFLGSLLAIRGKFFGWGVLLAAVAATVKPIGVFVIAAVFLTTLHRRNWACVVLYAFIAACVAVLYLVPIVLLTGSPLGNFVGYSESWYQKFPISVPFYPIITTALASEAPLSNKIKIAAWVTTAVFVVVYYGLMRGQLRSHFFRYPEETVASLLIVLFQVSYNSQWAWAEFPRFIAPVVPFLLAQVGIERLRPGWLLVTAPVFGLLAAVQIVGFQKLLEPIAKVLAGVHSL